VARAIAGAPLSDATPASPTSERGSSWRAESNAVAKCSSGLEPGRQRAIAAAAHDAGRSRWHAAHAFGTPIRAVRSGRGILKE
jgi:hypothetical protein